MKIIKEELEDYPLMVDDKYPEELRGNLFIVKDSSLPQYIQRDGEGIWSLPPDLIDEMTDMATTIEELTEQIKLGVSQTIDPIAFTEVELPREEEKRKPKIGDVVLLAEHFGVDGLVRLRDQGVI